MRPHTAAEALAGDWKHPYSRLEAAYPAGDANAAAKYWPPVSRIDNVAGDRNLVCSCPPLASMSARRSSWRCMASDAGSPRRLAGRAEGLQSRISTIKEPY